MPASLRHRPVLVAWLAGLASLALFAFHLGRPSKLSFDEIHYVPAARTLLALAEPANIEHPLLGKELIAIGIALLGDNPIGWRAMSALAGAATVVGTFAILWLLFGRMRTALFGALLTAVNGTVFVQARTAMLDGFLAAFLVLGIAALIRAWQRQSWALLALAGALFGCAVGVKWAAIPYVAAACLVILCAWKTPARRLAASLLFGLASLLAYAATFAPAFFYARDPLTLAGFVPFHLEMYARQTQALPHHPYESDWWTWPLLIRPIWYFYEPDMGAVRGVLMIGNPAIMWGGLAAVALCLWAGLRDRSSPLLGIAGLWAFSVAIYAVIPKSLGFYYYYHLSAIFLCLALAAAAHRHGRGRLKHLDEWLAIPAIALFVHFYPILAASPLPDEGAFTRWMWSDRWR